MRRLFFEAAVLIFVLAGPAAAVAETAAVEGVCQDNGCASTSTVTISTPAWQTELSAVQKSGDACKAEIEKFCDGIQVGEGRLEKCLKAHKNKLSKKCKDAQGWR